MFRRDSALGRPTSAATVDTYVIHAIYFQARLQYCPSRYASWAVLRQLKPTLRVAQGKDSRADSLGYLCK